MGIKTASPMFEESGQHLSQERSWDFFKDSSPGHIKFLELFVQNDPSNMVLKRVLIKAYVSYAFAVHETLALDAKLALTEDLSSHREALIHYTKALDYGVDYLGKKGISRKNLLTLDDDKLMKKLKRETSTDDLQGILSTAQAWGSLIQLQKENTKLASQISRVKILFDYVCDQDPTIEDGACDLFYAQHSSQSKDLYLKAIAKYPKHLLVRVNYLQFVALPSFDQEEYDKQALILKDELLKWENLNRDNLESTSSYKGQEMLNLSNAVAKKRFEFMENHKSKIF